jgi:hypothetical protein
LALPGSKDATVHKSTMQKTAIPKPVVRKPAVMHGEKAPEKAPAKAPLKPAVPKQATVPQQAPSTRKPGLPKPASEIQKELQTQLAEASARATAAEAQATDLESELRAGEEREKSLASVLASAGLSSLSLGGIDWSVGEVRSSHRTASSRFSPFFPVLRLPPHLSLLSTPHQARALLEEEQAAMAKVDALISTVREQSGTMRGMISEQEALAEQLSRVPLPVRESSMGYEISCA